MNNPFFHHLEFIQVSQDQTPHYQVLHSFLPTKDTSSQPQEPQQNCNLKNSTSTKPSTQLTSSWSQKSKSSVTKQTIPSRKSINIENGGNKKQVETSNKELKKINDNDKFICQSCVNVPNKTCQICHGKKQLSGTDKMIKFFEYVLDFKMGNRQSYRPKEQKITSKRTIPNEHCSVYFSSIDPKQSVEQDSRPDVRFSLCNDNPRLLGGDIEDRIKNDREIHYNYNCDQCDCTPIEGPRYHCNACQDFDLCETCYERTNHYHELQKIEFKGNKKALQKINGLLRTNQSSIRSNIKNACSIRNTIANKATKSWIR